jgi:hypothetical protein
MTFKLHDLVDTPLGRGMVQGRLLEADGSIKVLVSFTSKHAHKLGLGKIRGIWKLLAVEPEDCTLVKG